MSKELELYWCPNTRALGALWMLEELGRPFVATCIDVRKPLAGRDRGFMAASPLGKVPALRHGDVTVAESSAICAWLAEAHPESGLAPPPGDARRPAWHQWLQFVVACVEPSMFESFGMLQPNRSSHGWGDVPGMNAALMEQLRPGPWILGDEFSAVDVLLGTALHFMKTFGVLADEPALRDYIERCMARPAARRALERNARVAGEMGMDGGGG